MRTKHRALLSLAAFAVILSALLGFAACTRTATLKEIAVTTAPLTTQYTVGERFSKDGMVVTATYSDGTIKEVRGYTWSPDGALAVTDTKVTVSYTEGKITKTAEVAITVTEPESPPAAKELTGIAVTHGPEKTDYLVGDLFEKQGMVVTAFYSDDTHAEVDDYTWSPDGALAVTDTKVTVSYTEDEITKTAEVAITVTEPTPAKALTGIAVTHGPEKTEYRVGDLFEKQGMVVTASYSDDTHAEVDSYTWSPDGALAVTDTKVTVSYTEGGVTETAEVTISVSPWDEPDLTDNAVIIIEEDKAVKENCEIQSETGTSNGSALGSFQEGATVTFTLTANETLTGKLYLRLATGMDNRPAGLKLAQNYQITLNGEEVTSETALDGALGWSNYFDYFAGDVTLKAGTNVLVINYLGVCPHNFDHIKFVLGTPDADVAADGTFVFEEEDAAAFTGCGVQEEGGTVNGKALGSFQGGAKVTFTFTASAETEGKLYLRLATGMDNRPADLTLGQNYKITVNGAEISSETALDGTLGWSNYVYYLVGTIRLTAGENTIVIEYLGVCAHNFDNIKLELGEDANKTDIRKQGDFLFEETLAKSTGCGTSTEGSATIYNNFQVGATITYTLTCEDDLTARLYLRLGSDAGPSSGKQLGEVFKVTVNGHDYLSETVFAGDLGWANFLDQLVGDVQLQKGTNVIVIEYLGNAGQNFDAMRIVTGENG